MKRISLLLSALALSMFVFSPVPALSQMESSMTDNEIPDSIDILIGDTPEPNLSEDEASLIEPISSQGEYIVALPETSDAVGYMHGEGSGMHGHMSFSDEQLEKLHKLKNDFLDKLGPKVVALHAQKRALKDVLMEENIDTAKAQAIQNKINSLRNDIAGLKLEHKIGFLSTLTPEQQKELRHHYLKMSSFGGMWSKRRYCGMMMHHPMPMHARMEHHMEHGGGAGGEAGNKE